MENMKENDWEKFSEQTEKELIPTYQEEVSRRLHEVAEYIKKVPDEMPNKELMWKLAYSLANTAGTAMWANPEKTKEELLHGIEYGLSELGYTAIKKVDKFKHEATESLQGNEAWLQDKVAAKKELERLLPWAERGIGDERENAQAYMEIIYDKFPDLRTSGTGL
jgi:hypothetical protein